MNDLSLHILDIVQNSISAGATLITIEVNENVAEDLLTITIGDNGKGMDKEMVEKVTDPFVTTRTTRKVGLGLPLFKQSAVQSEGDLWIESEVGKGTLLTATFRYFNIDRPPLGNVANTVMLLVSSNPEIDFLFTYRYNTDVYSFDTKEIKVILDDIKINNPKIIKYLTEMIDENISNIRK